MYECSNVLHETVFLFVYVCMYVCVSVQQTNPKLWQEEARGAAWLSVCVCMYVCMCVCAQKIPSKLWQEETRELHGFLCVHVCVYVCCMYYMYMTHVYKRMHASCFGGVRTHAGLVRGGFRPASSVIYGPASEKVGPSEIDHIITNQCGLH
jgi:hypothetical protein